MNCRKCGHPIQIKVPALSESPPPSSVADDAPTRIGTLGESLAAALKAGGEPTPSSAIPASAMPVSDEEWFVGINGDPSGPFTREQVTAKMRVGTITPDSLAWRDGLNDWRPVSEILELSELRKSLALSLPAPPPSRPESPISRPVPPLPPISRPAPLPPPSRPSRPPPAPSTSAPSPSRPGPPPPPPRASRPTAASTLTPSAPLVDARPAPSSSSLGPPRPAPSSSSLGPPRPASSSLGPPRPVPSRPQFDNSPAPPRAAATSSPGFDVPKDILEASPLPSPVEMAAGSQPSNDLIFAPPATSSTTLPFPSGPTVEDAAPLAVMADPFGAPSSPTTIPNMPAEVPVGPARARSSAPPPPALTAPSLPDSASPVSSNPYAGGAAPIAVAATDVQTSYRTPALQPSEAPPPKKKAGWLPFVVTFMLGSFCSALVIAMLVKPQVAAPTPLPLASTASATIPTSTSSSTPLTTATAMGTTPTRPVGTGALTPLTTTTASGLPAPSTSAAPTATTSAPIGGLDLSGLRGSGPRPEQDQSENGGKAPGSGCYAQSDIQRVIGAHQGAVKRTCWTNVATTSNSASINVSITIGPQGTVESASASGDDSSVARCVENDVRRWTFPAAGCSEKTAFSLKFIRQ